jgi:phage I-like protein
MTSATIKPSLIALDARVKLDPATGLPTRIVALKWGVNETAQGPITIGPKTLEASKLWDQAGFSEVAIDFGHNTVPGHPAYKGEPAKIAAMSALSVVDGEGLIFGSIDWTEDGKTNRANYADFSPTVLLDDAGEVIFCHSGALCRNGATHGLRLLSADNLETVIAALGDNFRTLMAKETAAPTHSIKTPTVHKPGTVMINTDLIKKILQLPPDATDDDINAALDKLGTAAGADPDPADNPNAGPGSNSDMTALTAKLSTMFATQLTALEAKFTGKIAALTARNEQTERDAIVSEATARGCLVPVEVLPDKDGKGGLPMDALRTLCAALPEVVPLNRRTPLTLKTLSATGANGMTTEDREVCRTMGITEEQWKKHNAA